MIKDGRMDQCQQCLHPDQKGLHTCVQQNIPFNLKPGEWRESSLGAHFASYSTSPIKVFTVCVDPSYGRYTAFLGSDPSKKTTASSRPEAVAMLLMEQKLIVMTEID